MRSPNSAESKHRAAGSNHPLAGRNCLSPWASILLLAIACAGLGVRLYRDGDRYKREDFKRYYAEALSLRQGGDPWRINLRDAEVPPSAALPPRQVGYPPAFYLILSPLTRLRPSAAQRVWEALQVVSLIFALIIALDETTGAASGDFARYAFAFALLFPPLQSALHWSQPTPILLLLLIASWSCARRGRDISAGMLLTAATLLKVFPWIVAGYFLFRRRWKVLASSLISGIGASACLVGLYGIQRNLEFARGARVAAVWLDRARNVSLIGNLHWLIFAACRSFPAEVFAVSAAAACLALVVFSGMLTWASRGQSASSDGLCWSLWVLSSILLSPVAWDHYLTLLIPMYVFVAWRLFPRAGDGLPDEHYGYSIGLALVAAGLIGFLIAPYFAAARHMRCYLILALMSYAGLSILVWRSKVRADEKSPHPAVTASRTSVPPMTGVH